MAEEEILRLKFEADTAAIRDAATATRALDVSAAGLGRSSGSAGRGLLELSRAVEDLQYGVGGVLNNLPTLITSLGGPAGLAGVASLAAIGTLQLVRHWDDLTNLFGQGATETEAERMERLEKSTHRTAEETAELNRHKERQLELDRLRKTQDVATRQAGAGVAGGVGQVGGAAALREVEAALKEFDMQGARGEALKAMERFNPEGFADVQKGRAGRAEDLILRAQKGDQDALEQLRNLGRTTQAGRRSGFIEGLDPTRVPFAQGEAARAGVEQQDREREEQRKKDYERRRAASQRKQDFIDQGTLQDAEDAARERRQQEQQAERDRLEQQRERDQAADRTARRYGGTFQQGLVAAQLRRADRGQYQGDVDAALQRQVEQRLQRTHGLGPQQAQDVARRLVGQAREQTEGQLIQAREAGYEPSLGRNPRQLYNAMRRRQKAQFNAQRRAAHMSPRQRRAMAMQAMRAGTMQAEPGMGGGKDPAEKIVENTDKSLTILDDIRREIRSIGTLA